MDQYTLLDQAEEDALHASRLLNVEEKLFKRITRRLLSPDSCISRLPTLPPTPPPDASNVEEEAAAREVELKARDETIRQWREDVTLDFTAFDTNVSRYQFLFNSNEKERARYAIEKHRILATAQEVRTNTSDLRTQLEEAQILLALRKQYDRHAEKITKNPLLRPREEQNIEIEKLNEEIADLQREGADYVQTWTERRLQFQNMMHEGAQMLRLIHDEKDEPEDGDAGDDAEDEEENADNDEGFAVKHDSSAVATPRASGGDGTPLHVSHTGMHSLAPGSMANSRAQTPSVDPTSHDTEMHDTNPNVPSLEDAELEEGEARDEDTTAAAADTSIDAMEVT